MDRETGFSDNGGRIRELAGRSGQTGTARLRPEKKDLRRLWRALETSCSLCRCDEDDEAAQRICRESAMIRACARQALADGGAKLPSVGGKPRVAALMEAVCAGGDARMSRENLLEAIAAFDAVQPLKMEELWAVPEAARIAITRATARTAASVAERLREERRAVAWARHSFLRPGRGDAFAERALKLCGEVPLPAAQRRLDRALHRRGETAEDVVRRAHAARALDLLRLDNLLAARRVIDELDWQACFREVSRVDRELRADPSGVYGRMDDESRAAVRNQVSAVARRLNATELAVARAAGDAARRRDGREGTVCWWLYDDEGRRALLEKKNRADMRLPRMVPDPSGVRTGAALIALSLAALAALAACAGSPWLWPACLPPAWAAGSAVANRCFPRRVKPARLLKLELDAIPDDCRTLVVIPALLSDPDRAAAICGQLEALGCLEKDENIGYLLLGDFADAPQRDMPADAAILECARGRIADMNARAGREKYAFLHRRRERLAADGVWMGRDRKRGALTALNRLLLGEDGAEAAFGAEGTACERLKGRYRFVVTLDADTRPMPDAVRRLIGAMAHPLNRPEGDRGASVGLRPAVLQPRMELLASDCSNAFVELFAGAGGVDSYPVSVSNLWQDMTGTGIYAGKGIYDVAAFHRRLDGALPEGRVLSHDLIEGAIAGAGFLGDVALFDGCPAGLSGWMRRQHRWIRGDWQLLPMLFSRKPLPGGRRIGFADRLRMADNLLRSLRAPALLALLLAAVWTGGAGALLAALAVIYLEALLTPPGADRLKWRRATARLAVLPVSAWCALDAALRTLWRLGVSGRHLMDWVTAADAERGGGLNLRVPARAAAILMLPGLLVQGWSLAALALAALFWIGPDWIRDMERTPVEEKTTLSDAQRDMLIDLARDTWRFFETQVSGDGALPPDNVQLDPPAPPARRTSPTNIGLYLVGCLAAHRLGFIDADAMHGRMTAALEAVSRLEKWRGHLYNWYDIDSLTALKPRYVSSVDSGNLAASLLLCAAAEETGPELAGRMRALAGDMDFSALYDARRGLFAIGMAVDGGGLGQSHYDLLASESRILSFTAMMLGRIPAGHWGKLGRPCALVEGGATLVSWSGTMFEYLMPELFMRAPERTLLGQSARNAVRVQRRLGRRMKRPWGVSESGWVAFDEDMNYQYRAFGLPALALGGEAVQDVIAPYAAALALAVAPAEAAEELARMRDMGWADECGLYEAADYLRPDAQGRPALVKSHMAHHQGMILCAVCNALTGDSLRSDFMNLPQARALAPLLEEKPAQRAGRRSAPAERRPSGEPERRSSRAARTARHPAQTQLLHGGGATALVTAGGAVHYARFGVSTTRFSGDLLDRADAACVHLRDADTGVDIVLAGRAGFEPGLARFSARLGGIDAEMTVCASPEDGALIREIRLRNAGGRPARIDVADVAPVALARDAEWRAHAVFNSLFVESSRPAPDALLFRRRPRDGRDQFPALVHCVCAPGAISFETDYEKLVGRLGDTGRPGGIAAEWSGALGAVLNPVSALRARMTLRPGEQARLHFAMALLEPGESAERWLEKHRAPEAADRAERLAGARARAMLGFIGLRPDRYHVLQELAALLYDGRLAAQAKPVHGPEEAVDRADLWSMGLSGDRPLMALFATAPDQAAEVREAVRACAFYQAAGIEIDLALVDDGGEGYARPVRDMLTAVAAGGRPGTGGVKIIDGALLEPRQRSALRRAASLCLDGGMDFYAQARAALSALKGPETAPPKRPGIGASTLKPQPREADNGFGGFLPDGSYAVDVLPDRLPPAPWCDILAGDDFGMLLSERGGGFCWHGNSREARLTPYGNDALREGWGWMLYLTNPSRGEVVRLLPGDAPEMPFRVTFGAASVRFAFQARRLGGEICFCLRGGRPEAVIDARLENRALPGEGWRLVCFVDWLMGSDASDAALLNCWPADGACFATGACAGVGYLASPDAGAQPGPKRSAFLGRGGVMCPEGIGMTSRDGGWALEIPLRMKRGQTCDARLALGWAEDIATAYARVRALRQDDEPVLAGAEQAWRDLSEALVIETPDDLLNRFANGFLRHQIRASRVLGRAGLYQPGGAYGFRDQLQDVLALLPEEPERVRGHILRCAAHQFEAGDVMHWWHEPFRGVRTRISDDMLFLPYAAAAYVRTTGDAAVLEEPVPFLEDVAIPDDREDVYREMRPGRTAGTLHEHCMRAFRRAARTGAHGLALMGAGDWNDGMNRVGAKGRGESVWLSEFLAACAEDYAAVAPSAGDVVWLRELARRMRNAVEAYGWDGEWYLRAYTDDGAPLGSAANPECRIDAVSQAWAVLAGLDAARCRSAMDAAWRMLVDGEHGLIRLLTPPFEGRGVDPGYIRGYPAGVRENGAQYTHAALWLLLALIRMGDGARAHEALRMLLPYNHADAPEKAALYRGEPYVMAADIYSGQHAGRAGWTWYTGSAAWMRLCLLALLGYERRGDRVRLNALLGEWDRAAVTVRFGASRYRLECDRTARRVTLDGAEVEGDFIRMTDDGRAHTARFPARKA